MPRPDEAAERIASQFVEGNWKVELDSDDVKNWHEISKLLAAKGFHHINMNGTTSGLIKPYAIDAMHRKNLIKLLARGFRRLVSRRKAELAKGPVS
jgi:hypothetical protein